MDGKQETIEVHPAYVWDCSNCGIENFQRSVTRQVKLTDEEAQEYLSEVYGEDAEGDESDELSVEIHLQSTPINVVCKHCKTQFAVVQRYDPMQDIDDDDD